VEQPSFVGTDFASQAMNRAIIPDFKTCQVEYSMIVDIARRNVHNTLI